MRHAFDLCLCALWATEITFIQLPNLTLVEESTRIIVSKWLMNTSAIKEDNGCVSLLPEQEPMNGFLQVKSIKGISTDLKIFPFVL